MKHPCCAHEDAVAVAAHSGDWTPELQAHRDGCMICAELTLVVAAMAADAEELLNLSTPLPDPSVIWLRARLAEREDIFRRALRPIVWVQRATIAAVAAAGLAFAPSLWGFLTGVFADLNLNFSAPNLPRAAGSPLLVLMVSMIVLGGLALWELTAAGQE